MSAPINMPSKAGLMGLLFPLRNIGSKVKSANSEYLETSTGTCVTLEIVFAGLVVAGVVGELIVAFCHPAYDSRWETWGSVLGNGMIAIGVAMETAFLGIGHFIQGELSKRSKDELGEAKERAAKADLARAELEKKLWPRMLNQDQWDFIQGLRGKFEEISIAFETDAETRWFAAHIRDAFFSAGIRVGMVARAADVHSTGTLVFEPKGFDGSHPRTVEPLVELFRKADMPVALAIITGLPTDIIAAIGNERAEIRPLLDVPMIIVGGRFVIPPPHIEKAAIAAKAAMAKTARELNI